MKNEKITERDKDFAKWYTDVVKAAHLATYSNVKGFIIFEPNGYALWEEIQKNLDRMFKETGHRNVYMPLLIPKSLLEKEGELVEGFAPEVAWVTKGGQKELEEPLCVRPTSETLFSDYYHEVVKSYRDLPLKYNQWCSVFRWEKEIYGTDRKADNGQRTVSAYQKENRKNYLQRGNSFQQNEQGNHDG